MKLEELAQGLELSCSYLQMYPNVICEKAGGTTVQEVLSQYPLQAAPPLSFLILPFEVIPNPETGKVWLIHPTCCVTRLAARSLCSLRDSQSHFYNVATSETGHHLPRHIPPFATHCRCLRRNGHLSPPSPYPDFLHRISISTTARR